MPTSKLRLGVIESLLRGAAAGLALALLTAGPASAQSLAPDPASQTLGAVDGSMSAQSAARFDAGEAVRGHATFETKDTGFKIVQASFFAAASSDLAVSMYQIGAGNAREAGFGSWWQDSPVAFAISKSAVTVAFAYGLERLHKTKPKLAFWLGIAATSVEGSLVVLNAQTGR